MLYYIVLGSKINCQKALNVQQLHKLRNMCSKFISNIVTIYNVTLKSIKPVTLNLFQGLIIG